MSTKDTIHSVGIYINQLSQDSFTYKNQHSIRPDGCNSFEIELLDVENNHENTSLLSNIEIGCLVYEIFD